MRLLLAALSCSTAFLAPAGAGAAHDYGPVFSPDGRTIAFVRVAGSSGAIMLVDSDGRNLRTLVPGVFPQHLVWSPEGSTLAYTANGVWSVDVSDPAPRLLTTAGPEFWQPAWSPDGGTIAYWQFERCFRCSGVWLMAADGSQPREVVLNGRRPVWSPDGSALAITGESLVVGLDGRTLVPCGGFSAAWSPRGVYVAFTRGGLYLTNVQTGTTRLLTRLVNERIAWSADGKVIAGAYRRRIVFVRANDGRLVRVLPTSSSDGGTPSFAPEGWVAFAHRGMCGIDIAREDGTQLRRITRTC